MAAFLSDEWLEAMTAAAAARPPDDSTGPEQASGPVIVVQQVVTGAPAGTRSYVIEVGSHSLRFRPGSADRPDLRITEDYATASALARGELTAAEAFLAGRIRIGGDLTAATIGAEALGGWDDIFAAVRSGTEF